MTKAEHAGAIATASRLAVRTELANGLSPALDTLRDGMAGLSASVTAIARDMMPGLDRLRAGVDAAGSDLRQVVAGEVRRLHDRNSAQADSLRAREDEISALRTQLKRRRKEVSKLQARIGREVDRLRDRETQLAVLRHQMLSLQGDSELLHRIRGSRSWRFTRPLRFAARAMRGDVTRQDRALIRRWWMSKLAATRLLSFSFRGGKWRVVRGAVRVTGKTVHYLHANGDAVPSQPGPSASARPDVFMWAGIDWHFRTQRPQHPARGRIDAGHRVFYLSNNLRSEEHTSELQSLMRISYAVFCLKKKKISNQYPHPL